MASLRKRRLIPAAAALLAAVSLTFVACSSEALLTPEPGGTLTYGRLAATNDLDLHTQITANNAFAIDNIFETLVSFNEHGDIIDWLAQSHTISKDGLRYTFTLHPGVQFSDGSTLTASDVKFSLERNIDIDGPLTITAPIASITADDTSQKVTIELERPYTPFLSELTSFSAGVIPRDFGGKSEAEFFAHPIGTGPFAVADWDPEGDLRFVKNEHYWQEGKPYLDGLVYEVVNSDDELLQRLLNGEIDAVEQVPTTNAEEIDKSGSTTLLKSDSWAVEQLFFNTHKPEFADVRVRRAIDSAIDIKALAKATTFGTSQPANSLIPPSIEYSASDQPRVHPYNLQQAKKLLKASKYPHGFKAKLLIPSGNSQRAQTAQIIQESLAQIGITVEIEAIEIDDFRERFRAFDYDFMINSGQSDAPDPNGLVTFQADPEGFSKSFWTHYANPKVTELIAKGRSLPEGDARKQVYLSIQRILSQDAPFIPLYYASNLHGTTSSTHGLLSLPNGSVRFQDAWVDAD